MDIVGKRDVVRILINTDFGQIICSIADPWARF